MSSRWIAWLMRHAMGPYESRIAGRKRALFAGLSGRAIEIGCGARANQPYLPEAVRWIGTDPNPHMRPPLCASAERLPFPDASADLVIATLVLCSVRDPALVLAEVRRVLRDGGRFLFIEHVAGPPGSRMRLVQRCLQPVCRVCADGCNPLRDTEAAIRRAGFGEMEIDRFRLGLPHIAGWAAKAG